MGGFLRTTVVAGLSVAAGSWLGLGQPDPRAFLVEPTQEVRRAEPSPPPSDFAPLLHHEDDSAVGGLAPWHALNPDASTSRAWLLAEGPTRIPGRRIVTFTFDDGPMPGPTGSILRLLAKHKVKATFFVIGRYLDGDDERAVECRKLVQREIEAGHIVGNHTHDHENLAKLTATQMLEQIDRGQQSIQAAIGKRPIFFRPPYGKLTEFAQREIAARNLDVILWSVEAQDMERDDVDAMFKDILSQIDFKEGGIVLLHDARKTTVAVLKKLLEHMRGHRWNPERPERGGYEIVDLPQYLRETAASPQPYASREELEKARAGRGRRPPGES